LLLVFLTTSELELWSKRMGIDPRKDLENRVLGRCGRCLPKRRRRTMTKRQRKHLNGKEDIRVMVRQRDGTKATYGVIQMIIQNFSKCILKYLRMCLQPFCFKRSSEFLYENSLYWFYYCNMVLKLNDTLPVLLKESNKQHVLTPFRYSEPKFVKYHRIH